MMDKKIEHLQQNHTAKMQQANQNSPLESWFAWLGCETSNRFSAGKMTEDLPFSLPNSWSRQSAVALEFGGD